ncbi:unnamed protein product, partial [Rotaria sp. Silwood1]
MIGRRTSHGYNGAVIKARWNTSARQFYRCRRIQ